MKKLQIPALLLAASLTFSGCGLLQDGTFVGAGVGAGAGAAIGAGIGHVAGNTGAGAAIGAVVGGAAGALIGNKMDKQKKELEEQLPGADVVSVNDGQGIMVVFDSGLLFNTSSSTLSSASRKDLMMFAENLNANVDTNVEILGHTDSSGNDAINDPLSERRAKSVYDFLKKSGVHAGRMTYEGKGSHEPVASNDTRAGKQKNRRVEVYILPNEKMIQEAEAGTLK